MTRVNERDGLSYVWIPPGTYSMGCSQGDGDCFAWEPDAHQVRIDNGFWIGETEVTQQVYQRVTGKNSSRYKGPNCPVEQLTWNDAPTYCEALGMRLPGEAEWEYAARGGVAASRYDSLGSIAWYDGNGQDQTHPVATKKPNPFGPFDTLGSVWEWVQDSYQSSGKNMRILRGGSFYNLARDVRVSNRLWALPETDHRTMGVRCAGY
jgi:formylglycine-generating enzyme required for sulfatase activity